MFDSAGRLVKQQRPGPQHPLYWWGTRHCVLLCSRHLLSYKLLSSH